MRGWGIGDGNDLMFDQGGCIAGELDRGGDFGGGCGDWCICIVGGLNSKEELSSTGGVE